MNIKLVSGGWDHKGTDGIHLTWKIVRIVPHTRRWRKLGWLYLCEESGSDIQSLRLPPVGAPTRERYHLGRTIMDRRNWWAA